MVVNVLYFAALRDALSSEGERIPLPETVHTVGALRTYLGSRGAQWAPLLEWQNLRCARNRSLCGWDEPVCDGDEIAFFPPVTGG